MTYINLDNNYYEHLKIKRLQKELGKSASDIPIKLWCYASKHSPTTGELPSDADGIAVILDWDDDPNKMLQALLKHCLIHANNNKYYVHEWEKHQGHIIAFRLRAKKAAEARWNKFKSKDKNMLQASPSNAQECLSNAPYQTKPNQTLPNQTKLKAFRPPAIEEIKAYCKERNNRVNPQQFLDHYIANGWKRGKTSIKDWKACVRLWEQSGDRGPRPVQKEEKMPIIDPIEHEKVSKLISETVKNMKGAS